MAHTDAVRANRELWFRIVPGARAAYLSDPSVRLTVDSVDSALSMADRAMSAQGVPDDVRHVVLHYAVFKSETDGVAEIRGRAWLAETAAPPEPTCGVLNPKVVATCTEPPNHPSPIHCDAFGNTWYRRDGERPLGVGR